METISLTLNKRYRIKDNQGNFHRTIYRGTEQLSYTEATSYVFEVIESSHFLLGYRIYISTRQLHAMFES